MVGPVREVFPLKYYKPHAFLSNPLPVATLMYQLGRNPKHYATPHLSFFSVLKILTIRCIANLEEGVMLQIPYSLPLNPASVLPITSFPILYTYSHRSAASLGLCAAALHVYKPM